MSFKYIIIFIYTIVAIDESNTMAQPVQCYHYMEDSLKTNIVYHAISPYLYSISCFHIYIFICTPTEAQRGNRNQQPWQRQWTQRQPPVIPASQRVQQGQFARGPSYAQSQGIHQVGARFLKGDSSEVSSFVPRVWSMGDSKAPCWQPDRHTQKHQPSPWVWCQKARWVWYASDKKSSSFVFLLSKGLLGFHLKRALVTDICTKSRIWQTKINFKSQIWPLLAKAIFWPHLTFLTIPMSMQLLVKSFLLSILYPCK